MAHGSYLLQQLLNAFQVALLYALIAVAYVLFHGVTRRFNLAFGALAGWASYLTAAVFASSLARRGVPPALLAALGVAAGMAGAAVFGRLVAWSVRPLLAMPPLAILVATLGWGIALEEAMRLSAGSRDLWISPLFDAPLLSVTAGADVLQVTGMQAFVWSASALALALVLLAMRRSPFGRMWRAVSQDPGMAALVGIDVARVYRITAGLAAALAGLSGALAALAYGNATFHGGFLVAMKALFVAILGGLSSPAGAVAGAAGLALMESLWSAYFPGDYRDVVVFVALTALVVARPAGTGGVGNLRDPRV